MAAKNEEKRLAALEQRRRRQLSTSSRDSPHQSRNAPVKQDMFLMNKESGTTLARNPRSRTCYACHQSGHQAKHHPNKPTEATSPGNKSKLKRVGANDLSDDPYHYLLSDSDPEQFEGTKVDQVSVTDRGSHPRCAKVQIEGVPMYGIMVSGADFTIIGSSLFKKVAAVAKLKKRDFLKPDKVPRTYDLKPFRLEGKMMLTITFGDKSMRTAVYVKMDAHDQLLPSECVCRQLQIISYHPDVKVWRGGRQPSEQRTSTESTVALVPTDRVSLVHSIQVPPMQSVSVEVFVQNCPKEPHILFEPSKDLLPVGLVSETSLLKCTEGKSSVVLSNPTGFSQVLEKGFNVGEAETVEVGEPADMRGVTMSDIRPPEKPSLEKRELRPS